MFTSLASFYATNVSVPFDFVVVDEAQDLSVAQLRFLAALGKYRETPYFLQEIWDSGYSSSPFLESSRRGCSRRSTTLKVNYRTSHQIRMQADRLLGPELTDVDGNSEDRKATISLFNGPPPTIQTLDSVEQEMTTVSDWLKARTNEASCHMKLRSLSALRRS